MVGLLCRTITRLGMTGCGLSVTTVRYVAPGTRPEAFKFLRIILLILLSRTLRRSWLLAGS